MTSLRLRLFLTFLLVAILSAALVALFANRGTATQFDHYVARTLAQRQQAIAVVLAEQLHPADPLATQRLLDTLSVAYGQAVHLVDAAGAVWAVSTPLPLPALGPGPRNAAPQPRGRPWQVPLVFQVDPQATGDQVIVESLPLPLPPGPALIGLALAEDATLDSEQSFLGSVNRTFILGAVAAVAAAGLLSVGLARRILDPIARLTAAVRQMARGDLNQRVIVHSQDEIGELGRAFNSMANGLARQESLRRHMVSDIAHELRTPLANIRGYLEAVQDGVLEPEPAVIHSLYEETLLLQRLIEDLQTLSLAEAGQLSLDIQSVPPQAILEPVLAAWGLAARRQSVILSADIPPDLPLVAADPERVRQIWNNLLRNALTHTPAGGQIQVRATPRPAGVQFAIQDTGPGIPPEHIAHVFERFYRADPSRARATGGAGLGLAIVQALVTMHGGDVSVESPPGQGATFRFTLPQAASVPVQRSADQA